MSIASFPVRDYAALVAFDRDQMKWQVAKFAAAGVFIGTSAWKSPATTNRAGSVAMFHSESKRLNQSISLAQKHGRSTHSESALG